MRVNPNNRYLLDGVDMLDRELDNDISEDESCFRRTNEHTALRMRPGVGKRSPGAWLLERVAM